MPRELKPCGTAAAYRRHVRRGEPVDAACAQAARDQKNDRVAARRGSLAAVVPMPPTETEPEDSASDSVDLLAKARWRVAAAEELIRAGAPGSAALLKQHAADVAEVKRLEGAAKTKGSKLDELANRRAARIAGSAG